jgi:aminoglycoside 3-N-acetyltransferase
MIDTGHGREGRVGAATSHLFEAPDVVDFGVRWIESRLA